MRKLLCAWCVLMAACGGDGAPTAPSPTPQSISVTSSSDLLFIGASETFQASATMSDGSTRAVTGGAWISENANLASVDGNGRVTGVGSGPVNIYVDFQGRRGGKQIRVLPNFQGTWSGSYFITSCSQTGDFARANFCGNFPVNRVLPTNLNLTQDRDRVQGRLFLGTLGADASGPVQSDGQLLLTGAVQESGAIVDTNWSLGSSAPGRMSGAFSMVWRGTGLSGDMRVHADIRDLNRTSNSTAPAPAAPTPDGTLEGMIRRLAGGVGR